MRASYKKLWKLLIDREMKKRELCERAKVSSGSLAKLAKCKNVNVDILLRICVALNCEIGDLMEIVPEESCGEEDVKSN
jgi:DNA-binding Xre family transcriptional regulator